MRNFLILLLMSTSVFSKDCSVHLKKRLEVYFEDDVIEKLNKSSDKEYLLKLIERKNLKSSQVKVVNNLFKNLEFRRAMLITESWALGLKRKTKFWKKLRYIFSNKLDLLSERDAFFKVFETIGNDQRAFEGLNFILGKRPTAIKVDKVMRLLLAMNKRFNSKSVAGYSLNKFLHPLKKTNMSFRELEKMLDAHFDQGFSSFLLSFRYGNRKKIQGLRIKLINSFDLFIESIRSMFKTNNKSPPRLDSLPFLGVHALSEIAASPKKSQIIRGLTKVYESYDINFLSFVFENLNEKEMLLNLKTLNEFKGISEKRREVFSRINWAGNSAIAQIFHERNSDKKDSLQVIMRVVDNISEFVLFDGRKGNSKQVARYVNSIFDNLSQHDNIYGVSQLFKEVGAATGINNHKFRGAIFTFDYYKTLLNEIKLKVIGFEVPTFMVQELGGSKKRFMVFGALEDGDQTLKMVDFKDGKLNDKKKTRLGDDSNLKANLCFKIQSRVYINTTCENKKGVYKILLHRKIDFLYKEKDRYIFAEMKNYTTSVTNLLNSNIKELSFDSYAQSIPGEKYRFKWIVNEKSLKGKMLKPLTVSNFFRDALPGNREFRKLSRLGFGEPDLTDISDDFINGNLEFYVPSISTRIFDIK